MNFLELFPQENAKLGQQIEHMFSLKLFQPFQIFHKPSLHGLWHLESLHQLLTLPLKLYIIVQHFVVKSIPALKKKTKIKHTHLDEAPLPNFSTFVHNFTWP